MTRIWTVATRTRTRTTITRICLCRATSSLGFLVVFSFFSLAFLLFAFISTHWLGQGGFFYGLFVPGGVFLGFRVGFLLFHGFSLVCFYPFAGFLVFVLGCVCFEPLGSCSFVSRAFLFASLLHCFALFLCFIALLLSVNRVLNPVCGNIRLSNILP